MRPEHLIYPYYGRYVFNQSFDHLHGRPAARDLGP